MPDSSTAAPSAAIEAKPEPPPAPAPAKKPSGRRRILFIGLGAVLVLAAVAWGAWWLLVGSRHVTTDNAYVSADVAEITPMVAGPITGVTVIDTQPVVAGQVLATIDAADYQVALDQARAQLGQAQRRVQGYYANEQALAGQVGARQADIVRADAQIASARSDLERARIELGRRQRLAASGAVSGDELTQAQNQFATAQAALAQANAGHIQASANRAAAIGSKAINTALITGGVADNPELAAARANVRAAELNLSRTVLRAPFAGVIAKKTAAVGQRAQVGDPLMSVVPISKVYVDANFKEVQLRKVRVGLPATLTSDLYGGKVVYHGRVAGFAGGTGAAFALIPAQNATGNWIKVVQRLPVRIDLDPAELARRPLRVGLSMKADIDVSK